MARAEVFDAAGTTPTGDVPERLEASETIPPPSNEGGVNVTQKATEHVATANGPHEQVQKISPQNAGSFPLQPPLLHSEHSDGMGDTGRECAADSLENTSISKPGDALSDVIASDATLCELVLLWSSLDEPIRQAILTIAKRS